MGAAGSVVIESERVFEAQAKTLLGDAYDETKFNAETAKYEDQVDYDNGGAYLTREQAEAYLQDASAKLMWVGEQEEGELKIGLTLNYANAQLGVITQIDISKVGKEHTHTLRPQAQPDAAIMHDFNKVVHRLLFGNGHGQMCGPFEGHLIPKTVEE